MGDEFITAQFPEGEMPRTQKRQEMLNRLRRFIDGRARIREAGGEFGPWHEQREVIDRVKRRVDRMGVGPKLIVQRESDMEQLSIREVEVLFVPDLGASPVIELLSAELVEHFGMEILRDGGLFVCRFVDGTQTVSKHGFVEGTPKGWKGAARDWFVRTGGMEQLKEVYRFQVGQLKAHDLDGAHVIVDRTIYTHPLGEKPYTGAQHFHTHIDVLGGEPCQP